MKLSDFLTESQMAQLNELTRRGFLKGAGAAAALGAAGAASAEWTKGTVNKQGSVIWTNDSTDGSARIELKKLSGPNGEMTVSDIWALRGQWKRPIGDELP